MKISHSYTDKSDEEVAALFKDNAEHLIGEYSNYIGDLKWVSATRLEGAGHGVKASAYVSGNTINVDLKLPFALKLFSSKFESVVRGKLQRMGRA